jgi:hypothetical protein
VGGALHEQPLPRENPRSMREALDHLARAGQVRFCRYRFCATGELKYRGAVGLGYRSTYKRALFVNYKILYVKLNAFAKIESKSC